MHFSHSPLFIIERNTKINFPKLAQVENFYHSRQSECFDAKITIDSKDVSQLITELHIQSGRKPIRDFATTMKINNQYPWWKVNKEDVVAYYSTFLGSPKMLFKRLPKTHVLCIIISKNPVGKCNVFISY